MADQNNNPSEEHVPVSAGSAVAAEVTPVVHHHAGHVADTEVKHHQSAAVPALRVSSQVLRTVKKYYVLERKEAQPVLQCVAEYLLDLYSVGHSDESARRPSKRREYWSELARQGLSVILDHPQLKIDEERAIDDLSGSDNFFRTAREEFRRIYCSLPCILLDLLRPNLKVSKRNEIVQGIVEDFCKPMSQLNLLVRWLDEDLSDIIDKCASAAANNAEIANSPISAIKWCRAYYDDGDDEEDDTLDAYERLCIEAFEDCLLLSVNKADHIGDLRKIGRRFKKSLKALHRSMEHHLAGPGPVNAPAAAPASQ